MILITAKHCVSETNYNTNQPLAPQTVRTLLSISRSPVRTVGYEYTCNSLTVTLMYNTEPTRRNMSESKRTSRYCKET
jgi:hypothetical protein